MERKKIGIVGYGYVGKAMEDLFSDHFDIEIYDPAYNTKGPDLYHKRLVNECDLVIVCVPTPMEDGGEVDLSIIYETFEWLKAPLVLIKSTVPPGTTASLGYRNSNDVAFSPEYIGEGDYVTQWWKGTPHPTDIKKHDFQIFGGDRHVTGKVMEFFKIVLGPEVKYIQTDSDTAELVKYMQNSWGATKVTFCNEFTEIANVLGIDYNELRELWLLDSRISRMHTMTYKEKGGFGGKCLPKDTSGIVAKSIEAGYVPELLQQVLKSNEVFREI
jgi:UDPglucose 6-dehydrogenase